LLLYRGSKHSTLALNLFSKRNSSFTTDFAITIQDATLLTESKLTTPGLGFEDVRRTKRASEESLKGLD